jgi:hypothetical protein
MACRLDGLLNITEDAGLLAAHDFATREVSGCYLIPEFIIICSLSRP